MQLLSYWILSVLDHCEVPICLEIISETVVMKLECPLIRIFTSVDHGLILAPCIVSWVVRVMMIHSSKSVLMVKLEWMLNLLNNATSPCFPCFSHSLSFGRVAASAAAREELAWVFLVAHLSWGWMTYCSSPLELSSSTSSWEADLLAALLDRICMRLQKNTEISDEVQEMMGNQNNRNLEQRCTVEHCPA
jgi:hypothetical protein